MVINIGKIMSYDKEVKKSRLISIKDNKILVCNYNGYLMLPGGKLDGDESFKEALEREIKEELGFDIKDAQELVTVNNYVENYVSRDGTTTNRKIKTTYYITDENIDLSKKRVLSKKEEDGKFITEYIDINELINLINTSELPYKKQVFAEEILRVLNYYLKRDKLVDLHTHTNKSDGEFSPNEVVNQAINAGIGVIAITDHDTVKGLEELDYNNPLIKIIPGIEISVKIDKGRMHILGLGIDYKNKDLIDYLKEMQEFNRHNLRNIVNYLLETGIKLDMNDVEGIMKLNKNVGRPDIAKLLIKEGYVSGVQEAFDKYLIEAFNKSRHLNKGHKYKDALEVITSAKGLPILAHPNSLELDHESFEKLIKDMKENKLKGLEIFHPHMSEEEREYYASIAEYYNLLISSGTDYHGLGVKPNINLGTGINNIYITDLPILKELRK